MVLIAVFGAALLVAVLSSGLATRSVLSTSLLYLLGGALVSKGVLGLIHVAPDSKIVMMTADPALFAVPFADGMHASIPALRGAWREAARAPGLGMPLALVGMVLVTHLLARWDRTVSFPPLSRRARSSNRKPESRRVFEPLGEALAELAKFVTLLVFGALLTRPCSVGCRWADSGRWCWRSW